MAQELYREEIAAFRRYQVFARSANRCEHCGAGVEHGARLEVIRGRALCDDCAEGFRVLLLINDGLAVRPE